MYAKSGYKVDRAYLLFNLNEKPLYVAVGEILRLGHPTDPKTGENLKQVTPDIYYRTTMEDEYRDPDVRNRID